MLKRSILCKEGFILTLCYARSLQAEKKSCDSSSKSNSRYAQTLSFKIAKSALTSKYISSHRFTMNDASSSLPLFYSRFDFHNVHKIFAIYS